MGNRISRKGMATPFGPRKQGLSCFRASLSRANPWLS